MNYMQRYFPFLVIVCRVTSLQTLLVNSSGAKALSAFLCNYFLLSRYNACQLWGLTQRQCVLPV